MSRAPREKDPNDYEPPRPILTPGALPLYQESAHYERKMARKKTDPSKGIYIEKPSVELIRVCF